MKIFEPSLTRRLVIVLFALFLALLAISAGYTYKRTHEIISKDYDAQLISEAHLLWMVASEEDGEPKGLSQIDLDLAAPSMSQNEKYLLSQYTQGRGFRIWKNAKLAEQSDTVKALKAPISAAGFSEFMSKNEGWRVYAIHVPQEKLVIEAWEKIENRNRLLYAILDESIEPFIYLMPFVLLFLFLGVWFGLKDLHFMARQISVRKQDDLSPLVFERMPKELNPLKKAVNSLLEKLKAMLEREHEFIDNAAHELKTPLAVLKLQSQLIAEAPNETEREICIAALRNGVDRTRQVFDQILTLSRIHSGNVVLAQVSVLSLLRKVMGERAEIAHGKNIELELEGREAEISTSADLLSIIFGILIDNAIKYTPENGNIRITLHRDRVEISDSGQGIPEAERQKVFERFYRVKGDKTQGSGLGLAIVEKCASLLNIMVKLENSPYGPGLMAVVFLK